MLKRDLVEGSAEGMVPSGEHEKTVAYLVITADKGLAGAYNQNVIKEAMKLITEELLPTSSLS